MMDVLGAFRVLGHRRLARLYVPAAALLLPAGAAAQQTAPDDARVPVLFGHEFVVPALIRTPFVRTSISNSVGIGEALDLDFGSVLLPNGDTLVALNGDLTFAAFRLGYEHALRDWLGVWVEVEVAARLGTDVGSLLSAGVTLATGFELGWLAQVRETERSLLSASLFVRNSNYTLVDLPSWAEDIANGNTARLVVNTPSVRAGGGLSYAWVLNDLIGFIFAAQGTYGEALAREDAQFFFSGTAAMSLNLSARTSLPLGFALTLRGDSYPSIHGEQNEGWEGLGFRISYTGREDLRLSLTSEGLRVPFKSDEAMTVGIVSFDIQYFF